MNLIRPIFVTLAFAGSVSTVTPRCAEALPLQGNIAVMKAVLGTPTVEVRYGRGYGRWGGYRGWGYRRWGLGVAAGTVLGGAIASSAYYGGGYPYYGESYSYPYYGGGYAYDSCRPYGYTGYYRSRAYYGW